MSKRNPEKELWLNWSKKENSVNAHYPRHCDAALMFNYLCGEIMQYDYVAFLKGSQSPYTIRKSLIKELEERGYDLTTLKFSIKMKDK